MIECVDCRSIDASDEFFDTVTQTIHIRHLSHSEKVSKVRELSITFPSIACASSPNLDGWYRLVGLLDGWYFDIIRYEQRFEY